MAEHNPDGEQGSVSVPPTTQSGQPPVVTYYMGRMMRFYSVTESELESISSFNSLATFGFAAGSFVLALLMPDLLNMFVDYWAGKTAGPDIMARFWVKALVVGSLVIVFYGLGCWGIFKRKTRWEKIGSESIPTK